jgi:hypothetical protein
MPAWPGWSGATAGRLVLDQEAEHPSRWVACTSIAAKIGCSTHTLMEWVERAKVNGGKRAGTGEPRAAPIYFIMRARPPSGTQCPPD